MSIAEIARPFFANDLIEIQPLALIAAINQVSEGIILYELSGRIQHVSTRAQKLLGLDQKRKPSASASSELESLLSTGVFSAEDAAWAASCLLSTDIATNGKASKIGSLSIQWRTGYAGGRIAIIDEHQTAPMPENEAALGEDFLTGLATRAVFEKAIESALNSDSNNSVAAILLDLDHFKAVNDTYGHAVGDTLLQRVGQRLKSSVRAADLAARFGGDEFAILIPGPRTCVELGVLCKRVIELLRRSFLIDGQLVHISASIGIAIAPTDGANPRDLLKAADLALYESKSTGGSRHCFFEPRLLANEAIRRDGEMELRRALALSQFELYYQPQVDCENKLVCFEALIRWRHPERGLIPPMEFLPHIEKAGLTRQVGEWVLKTACAEAVKWPQAIQVAVNVSPPQLEDDRFGKFVKRTLQVTGLPGSRLELELTEESIVKNRTELESFMKEMREIGVSLAIDDFGTGYASLSQLASFQFDKIKIDKSLVSGDPRERALVRAIAQFSNGLGMISLAEGVESEEQRLQLQSDGCDMLQGYHLGRPLPNSQIQETIKKSFPDQEEESKA